MSLVLPALIAVVLLAVGSHAKPYDGQAIKILGPVQRGSVIKDKITEMAKLFTDEYGGTVEVIHMEPETFTSEARFDLLNGHGVYDGFWYLAAQFPELSVTGGLADLRNLILHDDEMKWNDVILFYRSVVAVEEGKILSVPWGGTEHMMYFREDVLARNGVAMPRTIPELLLAAKKINGTDMDGDGVPDPAFCHCASSLYGLSDLSDDFICAFTQSRDVNQPVWFDPDTMNPNTMQEGFARGYESMRELMRYAAQPYATWDKCSSNKNDMLFNGKCAFMFNYQYVFEQPGFGMNIGVNLVPGSKEVFDPVTQSMQPCDNVLCPKADDGVNYAPFTVGGWGGSVSHYSKHLEFAYRVMAQISYPKWQSKTTLFDPMRMSQMNPALYVNSTPLVTTPRMAQLMANYTRLMTSTNDCRVLLLPGQAQYFDAYFALLIKYMAPFSSMTTLQLQQAIYDAFQGVTNHIGRAQQRRLYRRSLGIRDTDTTTTTTMDIVPIVVPIVVVLGTIIIAAGIFMYFQRYQLKRRTRDVTHAPKEKVALAFTDVQNSTALWKEHPEAMRKAMETHHTTIREVMSKHHGYEVKTIGDSFMIATGSADAAVLLTNDIHTALLAAEWPSAILDSPDACVNFQDKALVFKGLRVRVGIDIGIPEVVYDEVSKGYDYYGDVPNCAARVESIAYGGQTLITGRVLGEMSKEAKAACNMVDVGKVSLKGIPEKVHVYQVMSKTLMRHFAVPKQGSSAAASEHNISLGLGSPRGLGIAAPKPIEEMTMVQIMHELSRVRATAAAAAEGPLNSPSNAVVPGINPLDAESATVVSEQARAVVSSS